MTEADPRVLEDKDGEEDKGERLQRGRRKLWGVKHMFTILIVLMVDAVIVFKKFKHQIKHRKCVLFVVC